jgi:hypothetical protein
MHVPAHEQACLATLLDAVHGTGGMEQVGGRGLEELVPGHQFQHALQFAPVVLIRRQAGHGQHLRHLATQDRHALRVQRVHGRRVQAQEAMLPDDGALRVVDLCLHVVRIGLAVHARTLAGFRERQLAPQQFLPAQVFEIVVQVQGTARVARAQDTEAPPGIGFDAMTVDGKVFIAEKRHVVAAQPVHELRGFLAVLRIHAGAVQDGGPRLDQALAHRREVIDHAAHVREDGLHHLLQFREVLETTVATDLEVQQALGGRTGPGSRRVLDMLQATRVIPAHPEVAAGDTVNRYPALIDLAAHGRGAERHIAAQHRQHRGLALPAVAADIRVQESGFRPTAGPALDKAQQAVEAAVEILRRAPAHVLGGKAAEERLRQAMQVRAMRRLAAAIDLGRHLRQQRLLEFFPGHRLFPQACSSGPALMGASVPQNPAAPDRRGNFPRRDQSFLPSP